MQTEAHVLRSEFSVALRAQHYVEHECVVHSGERDCDRQQVGCDREVDHSEQLDRALQCEWARRRSLCHVRVMRVTELVEEVWPRFWGWQFGGAVLGWEFGL